MAKKGNIPWNKGKQGVQICSQATRQKMRIARLGKPFHTEEFKKNLAIRNRTVEHRKKVSEGLTGKPWSELKRQRLSGPNSHLWKGGKTEKNKLIRTSLKYKEWRTAVFERDNYKCQECSVHTGHGHRVELQADHIKPFALFEELRFDISNGRTLCRGCHQKTDTWGVNVRYSKKKPFTITYA